MEQIYKKLYTIQKDGINLPKDTPVNTGKFTYYYFTLDKLMEVLRPILEKHKLLVFHQMIDGEMITRLVDTENPAQVISSCFPIQKEIEPQKVGSAITYGKRYNLGQIFNIITDEDDDGLKASTKPKTTHQDAHSTTSTPKTINGTPTCSHCGVDAVISPRTKNYYCPKFKEHPAGYVPLNYPNTPAKQIDEDNEAMREFEESLSDIEN